MANYTVTNFLTKETKNDSIFFNNMATSGSITITPNSGYVVSASDFSVINLPSSIESVAFTDSSTAGAIGNNVIGTATFSSDFVATTNLNIYLNIVGDAKIFDKNDVSFTFKSNIIDNSNINEFATSTFTDTTSSLTESTSDGIKTVAISSTLKKGVQTTIATLKVTATSGYYFKNKPTFIYRGFDSSSIEIKTTSVVKSESSIFYSDRKGFITEYSFDIIALVNQDVNKDNIILSYKAEKLIKDIKQVNKFDFGNDKYISHLGDTRRINVQASKGAEFSIAIYKSDGTSILSNHLVNDNIISNPFASMPCMTVTTNSKLYFGNNKNQGISRGFSFLQDFPANASETYTLEVVPKSGTTLSRNIRERYKLRQLSDPVMTFTATESQAHVSISRGSSTSFTGKVGKFIKDLKHINGLNTFSQVTIVASATGGTTFSTPTVPTWSSSNQSNSSWTNSVPSSSQGNNHVEILNISATRSSANTVLTVKYDIFIQRFGDGNTTFSLNIDNISTAS
jgi:hypothetical protein